MGKIIEFDDILFKEETWNAKAVEKLDPLLFDQYPFVREDMTVGEYFTEKKYYIENHDKFLKGEYTPLWKQAEMEQDKK